MKKNVILKLIRLHLSSSPRRGLSSTNTKKRKKKDERATRRWCQSEGEKIISFSILSLSLFTFSSFAFFASRLLASFLLVFSFLFQTSTTVSSSLSLSLHTSRPVKKEKKARASEKEKLLFENRERPVFSSAPTTTSSPSSAPLENSSKRRTLRFTVPEDEVSVLLLVESPR